jgi:hypothetical protein
MIARRLGPKFFIASICCLNLQACGEPAADEAGTGGGGGNTGGAMGGSKAGSGGVGGAAGTGDSGHSGTAGGGTAGRSAGGDGTGGRAGSAAGSAGAQSQGASAGIESGGKGGMGGGGTSGNQSGGAAGSLSGGAGGAAGAGAGAGGAGSGGAAGSGGGSGKCTASKATSTNASGSGPHEVVVETNSDPGIREGTIFRPADLGGSEKYPIFVWGEGGCSLNGLSNAAAMGEIASHGYFVVADGTPNGQGGREMDAANPAKMGEPLIAYIDWAIAENEKPCSAYYQSLDTSKIASNGFSCGGLMAEGTAGDPRITTWGLNSSGLFGDNPAFYATIHTPVLLVEGGTSDNAYVNGLRDYDNISALGVPILFFSKNIGHGGDLFSSRGGDFTRINLAWLNWWLKGDEGATGKGHLVGSGCSYCSDSAWEMKSANLP